MTRLTLKGYPNPLPDVLMIDMLDYADFRDLGYRPVALVFTERGKPPRDWPIFKRKRKNDQTKTAVAST